MTTQTDQLRRAAPATTPTGRTDARGPTRPAPRPPRFSSISLKAVMAVSGVVLFGFVLVHMVGNLKVWLGPGALDGYAAWLRDVGYPLVPHEGVLWALRVVLLTATGVHVAAAMALARRNRAAAGGGRRPRARSVTARTMPVTGIVVACFVVFHVLDLTTGQANPDFHHGAAHANLVASFSRPSVALFYVAAVGLLGAHLAHGLWSALRSIGIAGRRTAAVARWVIPGLVAAVVLGNVTIPLGVLAGWIS